MTTQDFPVQGLPSQGIEDLTQVILQKSQTLTIKPTLIIPMDQYEGKFKRKARCVGTIDACLGFLWFYVASIYSIICFSINKRCFGEPIKENGTVSLNRSTFYYFSIMTLTIGCLLTAIEIYTAFGLSRATNYFLNSRDESRRKARLWLCFNIFLLFYHFNIGCFKLGMGFYVSSIPDFLSFAVRILFIKFVRRFIPEMEMGGPETFKADESHSMKVQAVFMKPEIE